MAIATKQQDVPTTLARSIVATRYESLLPTDGLDTGTSAHDCMDVFQGCALSGVIRR